MKKSAKQKYRLFALPMSPEIFAIVEKQRFSRVSSRYALVYTDRRAPKGAVPVEEKDCARLSVEDQAWLSDCNALLIAESIRRFGDRIDVLHLKDYTVVPGERDVKASACGTGLMDYTRLLAFAKEKTGIPMTLENTRPENAEAARLFLEAQAKKALR